MTTTTNVSPFRKINNFTIIVLTVIIGLSSCREECLCPNGFNTIPLVTVTIATSQSYDIENYHPIPNTAVHPYSGSYRFDYTDGKVYYCSQENFVISDTTAMVIGSIGTLRSFSTTAYSEKISDDFWVSVNGITDDGVLYYAARNVDNYTGRVPIGESVSFITKSADTIALSQYDKDRLFGDDIIYDQDGNPYYYDWRFLEEWLPVPDSTIITTTRRIYINNIGRFNKNDFVDLGLCEAV